MYFEKFFQMSKTQISNLPLPKSRSFESLRGLVHYGASWVHFKIAEVDKYVLARLLHKKVLHYPMGAGRQANVTKSERTARI